jgi:hypothetical protein
MEKPLSESDQRKWDVLHTFCYAYICQPPQEMWEDAEFMAHRNELFELVGNCVHSTNWKSILSAKSQMRPITLSIKHAKEFYNSEAIGEKTEAYRAIEEYFKRTDWQRQMLRSASPPPLSLLTLYMKQGDVYRDVKESSAKNVSKKKRDKK